MLFFFPNFSHICTCWYVYISEEYLLWYTQWSMNFVPDQVIHVTVASMHLL